MQTNEYCKLISFYNNDYYIITLNEISFYNNDQKTTNVIHQFDEDQIITSSEILQMISYGSFFQDLNFILIKDYLYLVTDSGSFLCIVKLTEIEKYYSSSLFIPIKCNNQKCYCLIGLINSNNKLSLYLYGNSASGCESILYDTLEIMVIPKIYVFID